MVDQKTRKNQFSNEHRLTSIDLVEINILLMIKGHQKKAYFSQIDWNESMVQYLHACEWLAGFSQTCGKKGDIEYLIYPLDSFIHIHIHSEFIRAPPNTIQYTTTRTVRPTCYYTLCSSGCWTWAIVLLTYANRSVPAARREHINANSQWAEFRN